MNRADWTIVGLRIFGVYLVVEAVFGLFGLLAAVNSSRSMNTIIEMSGISGLSSAADSTQKWALGSAILTSFIGTSLVLGAKSFTSWLEGRDERPTAVQQPGVAPSRAVRYSAFGPSSSSSPSVIISALVWRP